MSYNLKKNLFWKNSFQTVWCPAVTARPPRFLSSPPFCGLFSSGSDCWHMKHTCSFSSPKISSWTSELSFGFSAYSLPWHMVLSFRPRKGVRNALDWTVRSWPASRATPTYFFLMRCYKKTLDSALQFSACILTVFFTFSPRLQSGFCWWDQCVFMFLPVALHLVQRKGWTAWPLPIPHSTWNQEGAPVPVWTNQMREPLRVLMGTWIVVLVRWRR